MSGEKNQRMKTIFLYVMALFYVTAGILHFLKPGFYFKIMPTYLPGHLQLIYLSGAFEIIFGFLLLPEITRPVAAWLIILLLIAVFPANIQMALNFYAAKSSYLWLTILRLPLQFVLIWWAWIYTGKP
jgi:uncharacterized membrane protein